MELNLGCGFLHMQGAINVDIDPRCDPDMLVDVTKELPFDDNTFDAVHANSVLEHVFNYESLMVEIHRVLKPECDLWAVVPYWPSRVSLAATGHVRQFVLESFMMFCNPRWYQPRTAPNKYMGLFDLIEKCASPVGEGDWITNLCVQMRKADKAYWLKKGVNKNLKNDVYGCFWCQCRLRVDGNLRICDHCGETFELGGE